MSEPQKTTSFEAILIIGLLAGSIYYFVIGEPIVALASLAIMQWIRVA